MKNIKPFALLLLLAICAMCFVGCGEKEAITTFDFEEKLTEKGFNVNVSAPQNSPYAISVAKNADLEILFYEFLAEDDSSTASDPGDDQAIQYAQKIYESIKNDFESKEPTKLFNVEVTMPSYENYCFIASEQYYIVSRVFNTVMVTTAPLDSKDAVMAIFEELGYK